MITYDAQLWVLDRVEVGNVLIYTTQVDNPDASVDPLAVPVSLRGRMIEGIPDDL